MLRIATLLALVCALPLFAGGLSKAEAKRLKQAIGEAAGAGKWDQVGELVAQLGAADDAKTVKFLVKVAEKAPPTSGVAARLADAAEAMSSKGALKELAKAGQKSKSEGVRRAIASYYAGQRDWDGLIGMLGDEATSVVALAAWRLADAKVEAAIDPMIDAMEQLEPNTDTWDVFKNALGNVLKRRFGSAGAYRSWWTNVQGQGGLDAIPVEEEHEGGTSVRLFGREIECTSVVFVLDVSGSMESIDADQADPLAGSEGTKTRDPGSSQGPAGQPQGRSRLDRAKIALNKVLEKLPGHFKVNLITYSTGVKVWKRGEPSGLHSLEANRADAMEWIESQKARGVTETDDALREALNVEGVRCVYLLSDGFATHDGTKKIPTETILQVVEQAMGTKHVTIHTMGFKEADVEMMQELAARTGGKYSDIR